MFKYLGVTFGAALESGNATASSIHGTAVAFYLANIGSTCLGS
jgi:hypothetical protein